MRRTFNQPVDCVANPTYLEFVALPMDLGLVLNNLKQGGHKLPEDLVTEVCLVFENCRAFNEARAPVRMAAAACEAAFNHLWEVALQ